MDAAEFERKYGADVKEKMVEDFMLIIGLTFTS
jgi:hypothetical protein